MSPVPGTRTLGDRRPRSVAPQRPLVSLIIACYNVERWLPDLLKSLEREMTDQVEAIFVVDGATDATGELVERWRDRVPHRVHVSFQENAGAAAARNTGLALASGVWVSFPDGDDRLGRGYLRYVTDYLRSPRAEPISLLSTNLVSFRDESGFVTDDHPLRWKYASRARVARLADEPELIHLSGATAFLRLDALRDRGLGFDTRIRPSFEDGALIARYLLAEPDATIALLPKARYFYRRRGDASSLIQTSWSSPDKFDAVLRYGYLAILREARARGAVPRWLQNTVLYDLSWYFRSNPRAHTAIVELGPLRIASFYTLLGEILALIDRDAVSEYSLSTLSVEARVAMLTIQSASSTPRVVAIRARDRARRRTQISWFEPLDGTEGEPISCIIDGRVVVPAEDGRRTVSFLTRRLFAENTAWLSGLGNLSVLSAGQALSVIRDTQHRQLTGFRLGMTRLRTALSAVRAGLRLLRRDRKHLLRVVCNLLRAAKSDVRSRSQGGELSW